MPVLLIQTSFVGAMVLAVIAVNHSARGQGRLQDDRLVLFTANLGFLHLFGALAAIADSTWWARLMWLCVAMLPATFAAMLRGMIGKQALHHTSGMRLSAGVFATAVSVLCITPWLIAIDALQALVVVLLFGLLAFEFDRVRRAANAVDAPLQATRLRLLWSGAALTLGINFIDVSLDRMLIGMGIIAQCVYTAFLSVSLLRERLLDVQDLLARSSVFGIITLVVASVYSLMVTAFRSQGSTFVFATVVSSALLVLLLDPLRNKVTTTIMRIQMAGTKQLTDACWKARDGIRNSVLAAEMMQAVVRALYEGGTVTRIAIYLRAPSGSSFLLRNHAGSEPKLSLELRDHPEFFSRLRGDQSPLSHAEISRNRGRRAEWVGPLNAGNDPEVQHDEALMSALQTTGATLLLPVSNKGEVVGLLAIDDDRRPEGFTRVERSALQALAARLCTGILNTRHMDRLRLRDRLAALGEMSAGLAHEIRNPLGSIHGAVQLLEAEGAVAPSGGEFMEIITTEVTHLNRVVQGFLDYARPGNLEQVATETVPYLEAVARQLGDDLALDLSPGLSSVVVDRDRLLQVLRNLVRNAQDVSPPEGIELAAYPSSRGTVIEVRDRGDGIPDAMRNQLFTPFATTKARGTGLGLAISQRIVKDHHGQLELLPRPGGGTIARVTLPLSGDSQAPISSLGSGRPRPT
jgi:two-component system, NtrC family, sensor histidine kinase HydH